MLSGCRRQVEEGLDAVRSSDCFPPFLRFHWSVTRGRRILWRRRQAARLRQSPAEPRKKEPRNKSRALRKGRAERTERDGDIQTRREEHRGHGGLHGGRIQGEITMERQTRGRRSHVTACRAAHLYSITFALKNAHREGGVWGGRGPCSCCVGLSCQRHKFKLPNSSINAPSVLIHLHSVSDKMPVFFASCLLLLRYEAGYFKYVSMSDFVHSNSTFEYTWRLFQMWRGCMWKPNLGELHV